MNKILKLGLVLLFVVASYMAFQYIFHPDPVQDETKSRNSTFQMLGKSQKAEWDSRREWDESLFKQQIDILEKKHQAGNLKNEEFEQLRRNVCTYAINKTGGALEALWKSSDCIPDKIKANYAGVNIIRKYSEFSHDHRVERLTAMKNDYDKICYLVRILNSSTLGSTPDVDDNANWPNFRETTDNIERSVSRWKESTFYSAYFSNIAEIRDAFASYKDKFAPAADLYYIEIRKKLIRLFRTQCNESLSNGDITKMKKIDSNMIKAQNRLSREWKSFPNNSCDCEELDNLVFNFHIKIKDYIESHKNEL